MNQPEAICIHCGEPCGKNPVIYNENPFCCEGCSTVYQLLNQNSLGKYYTIMQTPGIKINSELRESKGKYDFLDKEDILSKLLEFRQGSTSKVTLFIPSIHCSSCIWLLENLNRLHEGIVFSSVNFLRKEASIVFKHEAITLRQLVELLASIHYVPELSTDRIERKDVNLNTRKLVKKIGLAGFCFANIMLLSLPEYLTEGYKLERSFSITFSVINFALAIPLMFYSASDYLKSGFKNLRHGVLNIDLPISVGILALFFQSCYDIITMAGPGYFDSLAGFVFFLLIGKWYQEHTYQALSFERNYKSYFPVGVTRIAANSEESVLLKEIKVGDKIRIRNQEIIPADGTLLEGKANINYSFVTGESKPVQREPGQQVFAGGRQYGGAIVVEIITEVEQSKLTRLWNEGISAVKSGSRLETLIDKVSHRFTLALLVVSTLTLIYWLWHDQSIALRAFVSVLIVACPCALALTLPFTFGNTMRIFGSLGFFLKKSTVVEELAKIDTIVFDKTGTITRADALDINWTGTKLNPDEYDLLLTVTRNSTHPLSQAISRTIESEKTLQLDDFKELASRGIIGRIGDNEIRVGSEEFITGDVAPQSNTGGSKVFVAINGVPKGHYTIGTSYRTGIDQVIDSLSNNFELHMISGDNSSEKDRLKKWFSPTNMHFDCSPNDKLEYIKSLKKQGKRVLMIGDGLNDAGALAESNAGISIADDVYMFSPACDAILESNMFKNLHTILKIAQQNLKVVHISFIISLSYNIIGLGFATQGLLSPVVAAILMPISSVTVVGFVTLATNFIGKQLTK